MPGSPARLPILYKNEARLYSLATYYNSVYNSISSNIGVWSCLGPESIISDLMILSAMRLLTSQ
jgi:hypothetical protein